MTQRAPREWRLVGDMAENYERYLVPAVFRPWATDLLDLAAPRQGECVLDVACATGIVARLAAERVGAIGKVVGLDLNPAMLAVAGSVTPEGASIEWRQANAEDMPLADAAFDLVLCQQGLQFFPNKPVALREIHRVLTPGGRLALSVWRDIQHIPGYTAFADALERYVSPESAAFFYMTASLDSSEELQSLMEGEGFQEVTVRSASRKLHFSSPEAFVWEVVQSTPLAWMTAVAQSDDSTRESVVNEVAARLHPYVDDEGLAFPIEARVVTAQKCAP